MTVKEKIKLWAKGRLFELMNGVGEKDAESVLTDILSFIDSLHEEPVNEELEKVAYEYSLYPVAPSKFVLAEQGFKDGANWQKQQLMKKAIEGIVTTNIDGWINVMTGLIRPEEAGANFGDKVKLIIIKEDKV